MSTIVRLRQSPWVHSSFVVCIFHSIQFANWSRPVVLTPPLLVLDQPVMKKCRFNPTDITITNLRLAGCGAGVLVTQTVPLTRNIAIVGNVFADIRGPMSRFLPAGSSAPEPWAQDWGCAIALAADNSTYGATLSTENLTVANNVGVRIDQFYSNNQPGPGWNDGPKEQRMGLPAHGVVLSNNTVQACGYNCVEMGGTTHMTVSSNVFLRDTPPDMFVYGTTDIILGDVDGTSSIIGNDFNRRGEYEGGPDGERIARPAYCLLVLVLV